jgi:hypothetical protein
MQNERAARQASGIKTGGLPQVAASRYDSTISLPGAGDGISKFTMNRRFKP